MNLSPLKFVPLGMLKGILFRIRRTLVRGDHPTFLLLNVTDRCNCRCTMCQIWRKAEKSEMTLEEYERLFQDPIWRRVRILSLTGGEPFLRKDLKDIILSAAKHLPRLERISLPTNGLLTSAILETTRNILAELPSHIFLKIGISLDGPREIHDRMRGVPGAFEKAVETLRQLQKLHDPRSELGLLSLFTEENADLLPECHQIFTSLTNQVTWTLATESEFFQNVQKGRSSYSDKTKEKILSFLDHILIPFSPEKAYLYSKYKDHLLKKRRTYPCLAGYRSAYVDTRGNLLLCHYLNDSFSLGNFQSAKESLEAAWFSKDARLIRSRLVSNVYCTNCSNNCDFRNLVQEDFWNFFWYLVTHPVIPIKVLFKRRKK